MHMLIAALMSRPLFGLESLVERLHRPLILISSGLPLRSTVLPAGTFTQPSLRQYSSTQPLRQKTVVSILFILLWLQPSRRVQSFVRGGERLNLCQELSANRLHCIII
jgi:hypothetical protein